MTATCSTNIIARGNTIRFSTKFYDNNDEVVNPTTVTLFVHYPLDGDFEDATQFMDLDTDGETYFSDWDSDVSDSGVVEWSIVGQGSQFKTVKDGRIRLTAGGANPDPS